jgi:cysteine desulfurase family protein
MKDLVYLDNGATSFPKPEAVYRFMDSFYRNNGVSPGRSGYDLSIETGNIIQQARAALATYFNGKDPNRLIFSANSTDALNLAINGLLAPGDHVITTTLEHNAVLRPLYHMAMYKAVEVDHIPFDQKGFVHPEDFIRKIKSNTRLVVVNHGSNVIGTVQPLKEIGQICRENGVTFLVDASQTAGKLPIDIAQLNIDVIAFTGHKALMGPTGIGGLYVEENVTIRQTRSGGTGVRSAQRLHLEEYPYRLEAGTLNTLGIAGLYAGINWVINQGIDTIHHHEMALTRQLREGLDTIKNVVTYCSQDLNDHIGILSFNIRGFEAGNTATILDADYKIACRAGLQCAPRVHEQLGTDKLFGTVRMGVGPFNTQAQVAHTLKAISEIAERYGK